MMEHRCAGVRLRCGSDAAQMRLRRTRQTGLPGFCGEGPGVDDHDTRVLEIASVARSETGIVRAADSRDLSIEDAEGSTKTVPGAHDQRIPFRTLRTKRMNSTAEVVVHQACDGDGNPLSPPAARKPRNPIEKLGK